MTQYNIFGEEEELEQEKSYSEKIQEAKDILTLAKDISLKYYHEPLIIAYSGGKDSDVMLDIALSCLKNEEMEVRNSHTTVDAPQTVKHIEKVFSRLNGMGISTKYKNRFPVEKTMWSLIEKNQMPPTRLMRYCCAELKESQTPNRIAAIGVRADESNNRRGEKGFQVGGGTPTGNNGH